MRRILTTSFLVSLFAICAFAQTTEFTYQGSLSIGAPPTPASGNYDFEFRLFSVDTGGSAIGTLQRLNTPVANGAFGVKLDFGAQFPGAVRYLEIAVKPAGGGSFTTLSPRQQISNSPYSVRSLNAASADTANQLGGIAATGFIQNTTALQSSSNFNISGNGNIGGRLRVEGIPGGSLASFGGNGNFQIDSNGVPGGRFAILENGNVGIGTSSPPTYKLHVSGTGAVRSLVNSDSNAGFGLALGNQPKWSVATVTGGQFQIFNDATGQNAVWIDSASNNVGIGTNAPGSKLHVNVPASTSPISAASIDVQSFSNSGNAVASHFFRVRDIGSGAPSAFFIRGDGKVGIGTETPSSKVHVVDSTSNLQFGNEGGISVFRVQNSAPDSRSVIHLANDTQAWQIRVDGPSPNNEGFFDELTILNANTNKVAISIASDGPGYGFLPSVGIGTDAPTETFEVRVGGTTLADFWSTRSSVRIKSNIQTIPFALQKLMQLRGVNFDYRDSGKHSIGFVAEEVGRVLPEVVEYEANGRDAKGMDYNRLTPVVVEAIKEQQAQIEALEKLVKMQQLQIDALKKLLCAKKFR